MTLSIFNTLSREKQRFVPQDKNGVSLYLCGPTVYSYAHIGNGRSAVAFDLLYRVLIALYGQENVVFARNFTDIDDKINAAAKAAGVPISEITNRFAQIYLNDMAALGCLTPNLMPRVTGHIPEIIAMVERLIEAGHAYISSDGVYFNVPSMADYGGLSGRVLDENVAGARIAVDEEKKNPADFALWKFPKADEPSWPASFGEGRPGWHIECSAMIEKAFGNTIDIHAGGLDLIFPHHENEIAQSQCSHDGVKLANYWMHNGFLTMSSEKMSKSVGNVALVHDLIKTHRGEVLRLSLLSAHYRAPLDWSDSLVEQSKATLTRLYRALGHVWDAPAPNPAAPPALLEALCDDLNTPKAFAVLAQLASAANLAQTTAEKSAAKSDLLGAGQLMGLLLQAPDQFLKSGNEDGPPDKLADIMAARANARANKDWALADQLRAEARALGFEILDGKVGQTWQSL